MAITGQMVNWAPFWIAVAAAAVGTASGFAMYWAVRGAYRLRLSRRQP